MNNTLKFSKIGLFIAVLLAMIVVILGAYTRLTNAGLGCPDWPGCYNQLLVPHNIQQIQLATEAYPQAPVHIIKAWTEMIHRYAAGTLGVIILIFGLVSIRKHRHIPQQPIVVPVLLLALVLFQILLGRWTVTLKLLPIVVMGHLLGGLSILALLWWLTLKMGNFFPAGITKPSFKPWAILGLIIVAMQIALGGWTSANYAALACPSFPYCSDHLFFPQVDFKAAFNILNFGSTHLSHAALITIQMTHRIGALITGVYVGLMGICLVFLRQQPLLRKLGLVMLIILIAQISLGILNVEMLLPLAIAVLHNAMAALLLLTMVTFVYLSFKND